MGVLPFNSQYVAPFEQLERMSEAEEAAEDVLDSFEFDETDVEHRAKAIHGAISVIEFSSITGQEFWMAFANSASRQMTYEWATKAKATIDDIVASFPAAEDSP